MLLKIQIMLIRCYPIAEIQTKFRIPINRMDGVN
jgi:hypothetical protein